MRRLALIAALAASVALATPALGGARKGARYTGLTKQDQPIGFTVTRSGKAVRRLSLRVDLTCSRDSVTSARSSRFVQRTAFIRVNRDVTFSGDTAIRPLAGGEVTGGRFTINGRFSRSGRRVRGAFRERLRLLDGLRCDSGEIAFSATALPRRR